MRWVVCFRGSLLFRLITPRRAARQRNEGRGFLSVKRSRFPGGQIPASAYRNPSEKKQRAKDVRPWPTSSLCGLDNWLSEQKSNAGEQRADAAVC
jgi:hypothetical protein